jgi:hypothetical protein
VRQELRQLHASFSHAPLLGSLLDPRRSLKNDLATSSYDCEKHYQEAKNDLANVFLERCLELARDAGAGVTQIVMPQNWLFLAGYKKQRETLLKTATWNLLVRLGPGAFETIGGEVVNVILMTHTRKQPPPNFLLRGLDVSAARPAQQKAQGLKSGSIASVSQSNQLSNPDSRVALTDIQSTSLLADIGDFGKGSTTGDSPRFLIEFWQVPRLSQSNVPWVDSPTPGDPWSGRSLVTTRGPLDDGRALNAVN